MANDTLTVTTDYADGEDLTQALLDTAFTSIETWGNNVKDNLNQLKADIMPSGYTFDDDGSGNLTNTIFNKQTSVTDYATAAISLGTSTDAAWTDVDATNAALTFTPEAAGKYLVTFQFSLTMVPTGASAISVVQQLALYDGTTRSQGLRVAFTPVTADATMTIPVTIQAIYTFTAAAQTIKLQKYVTTASNIATNGIVCSSTNYGLSMFVQKI